MYLGTRDSRPNIGWDLALLRLRYSDLTIRDVHLQSLLRCLRNRALHYRATSVRRRGACVFSEGSSRCGGSCARSLVRWMISVCFLVSEYWSSTPVRELVELDRLFERCDRSCSKGSLDGGEGSEGFLLRTTSAMALK